MASRKERIFLVYTFEMNYETALHSHFIAIDNRKS